MVTDIHVHIQPWDMLLPEVSRSMRHGRADLELIRNCVDDPGALVRHLDAEGIDRVALVNYPSPDLMGFTDAVNDWVIDYCRPHPDRLIPVGSVHPRFSEDPGGEARRILDGGIRILKVHPPHQLFHANAYRDGGAWPGLAAVYDAAQERGAPVMVHTGTSIFPGARNRYGNPMDVDDVAVDFPDLPILLAHGGRPLWMDEAFFLLRRHPNVHLDVSGIPPARLLDYFPRLEQIADKVLWGTDWPAPGVPGLRANLDVFRGLGLPPAVQDAVLHGNAARLLGGG
ncbi:MAG: amidohydrolase family protein [Acidobacteriota bacterium]